MRVATKRTHTVHIQCVAASETFSPLDTCCGIVTIQVYHRLLAHWGGQACERGLGQEGTYSLPNPVLLLR